MEKPPPVSARTCLGYPPSLAVSPQAGDIQEARWRPSRPSWDTRYARKRRLTKDGALSPPRQPQHPPHEVTSPSFLRSSGP